MVRRASRREAREPPGTPAESASTELATLTALAQALSGPADLAESLEAALATVADVLGLETGWVWLLDESGEARLAAARALPTGLREHPDAMHGDCYCLKTFRAGDLRGAANVNVVWCSRLAVLVDDERGENAGRLQCHASVPLAVGDRHLGMLNVASRDWRVLSDAELSLLTTAGALVSLAVERSRLEAAGARAVAAEERNKLAREIHDTLAQGLAALTMQLEVADSLAGVRRDAGVPDTRLETAIGRALVLARSTLDEARHSVLDLREGPLEGRSLEEALASIASTASSGAEVRRADAHTPTIDLVVHATSDVPLSPAIEQGLYRIAQQAVANAVRHASATNVRLHLTRSADAVGLRIEDDGEGFDPTDVRGHRFGLVGMQERARLMHGTLTVHTAPGAGTVIDVRVPTGVRLSPFAGDQP